MLKRFFTPLASMAIAAAASFTFNGEPAAAQSYVASGNGRYSNLVQVLPCAQDRGSYGDVYDYGYWGGGSWCGRNGLAGYWVYEYPNWYVWAQQGKGGFTKLSSSVNLPASASADGNYYSLQQILTCHQDRSTYGDFSDYGYWGGGSWCGETGQAGYWVYVYPNWYVWGGAR